MFTHFNMKSAACFLRKIFVCVILGLRENMVVHNYSQLVCSCACFSRRGIGAAYP